MRACTITVSTGVNQTGNNTIELNDAGDTIVLVGRRGRREQGVASRGQRRLYPLDRLRCFDG